MLLIPDDNQPNGDGNNDKDTDKDKDQTDINDQETPEGDGKGNDYAMLAGGWVFWLSQVSQLSSCIGIKKDKTMKPIHK